MLVQKKRKIQIFSNQIFQKNINQQMIYVNYVNANIQFKIHKEFVFPLIFNLSLFFIKRIIYLQQNILKIFVRFYQNKLEIFQQLKKRILKRTVSILN
jgi:hypothetical protein